MRSTKQKLKESLNLIQVLTQASLNLKTLDFPSRLKTRFGLKGPHSGSFCILEILFRMV
jgi:hypothetical protein